MDANERPVSTQDLADRLMGEEHRQAQEAFAAVNNRMQQCINMEREMTGTRADRSSRALERVKTGLSERDEGDIVDRLERAFETSLSDGD